ncbi:transforming growth factor beta activator LRRC32 [Stigmatopora nigra]
MPKIPLRDNGEKGVTTEEPGLGGWRRAEGVSRGKGREGKEEEGAPQDVLTGCWNTQSESSTVQSSRGATSRTREATGILAIQLGRRFARVKNVKSTRPGHIVKTCQVGASAVCSDLSLSGAPADLPSGLRALDLSHNRLQNLSRRTLADRTDLWRLDLRSNEIRFIQPGLLEAMKELEALDLSGNRLDQFAARAAVPTGRLPALRSLDLSGNGLYTGMADFFLADSPSLEDLSLSGNGITKIGRKTFGGASSLRRISLRDNVIMEIEDGAFDSLDALSELDLSLNSIACITDFNLSRLSALNLSRNSLELFRSSASERPYRLALLDLSQNKLPSFPLLPANNAIRHLNLSRNRLRGTDGWDWAESKTPQVALRHLRHLDLSHNRLAILPPSFLRATSSLEVLNASNNCVTWLSVPDRELLAAARIVDLGFNSLRGLSIREGALPALEELFLRGNGLGTLAPDTFRRLPSLNLLRLEENNLRACGRETEPEEEEEDGCVFFSSVPKLKYLYLSRNELKRLPGGAFAGSPLDLLDLSLNPGLSMHPDSLAGLEGSLAQLLLRDNNMSRLTADVSSLRGLKLLDLSTNRLSGLPAWSPESSLETLKLQNNSLVTLDAAAVAPLERSLKTLYVGDNPLSCCQNPELLRLLRRPAVVVPDIRAATCLLRRGLPPVHMERVTREMCRGGRHRADYVVGVAVALFLATVALGLLLRYRQSRKPKSARRFRA